MVQYRVFGYTGRTPSEEALRSTLVVAYRERLHHGEYGIRPSAVWGFGSRNQLGLMVPGAGEMSVDYSCASCGRELSLPETTARWRLRGTCPSCELLGVECVVCGERFIPRSEDWVEVFRENSLAGEVSPVHPGCREPISPSRPASRRPSRSRVMRCEECGASLVVADWDLGGATRIVCARCRLPEEEVEETEPPGDVILEPRAYVGGRVDWGSGEGVRDGDTVGFELEVECGDADGGSPEIARRVLEEWGDWVVCKRDGSLHCGFEIVSRPMGWGRLLERRGEIDGMLGKLKAWGVRSYQPKTCGLHVHMGKSAIAPLTLYKTLRFFTGNRNLVVMVSRRGSESGMNQWAAIEAENGHTLALKVKGEWDGGTRYVAVNLLPSRTVEFRAGRGTLNPEGFWSTLSFPKAVLDFCRASPLGGKYKAYGDQWMGMERKFGEFVGRNQGLYPHLWQKLMHLWDRGAGWGVVPAVKAKRRVEPSGWRRKVKERRKDVE